MLQYFSLNKVQNTHIKGLYLSCMTLNVFSLRLILVNIQKALGTFFVYSFVKTVGQKEKHSLINSS